MVDDYKDLVRGLRQPVEELRRAGQDFAGLVQDGKTILDAIEEDGFADTPESRQSLAEGIVTFLAALLSDSDDDEDDDDDDDDD